MLIGNGSQEDADKVLGAVLFYASAQAWTDVRMFYQYDVDSQGFTGMFEKYVILPTYVVPNGFAADQEVA